MKDTWHIEGQNEKLNKNERFHIGTDGFKFEESHQQVSTAQSRDNWKPTLKLVKGVNAGTSGWGGWFKRNTWEIFYDAVPLKGPSRQIGF